MFFPGSFCTIVLEQRNNEQRDCPPHAQRGYIIGTLSSTFSPGAPPHTTFYWGTPAVRCQTFVVRCSCCDRPGEKNGQSILVLWNNITGAQEGSRIYQTVAARPQNPARVKDAHSKSRFIHLNYDLTRRLCPSGCQRPVIHGIGKPTGNGRLFL